MDTCEVCYLLKYSFPGEEMAMHHGENSCKITKEHCYSRCKFDTTVDTLRLCLPEVEESLWVEIGDSSHIVNDCMWSTQTDNKECESLTEWASDALSSDENNNLTCPTEETLGDDCICDMIEGCDLELSLDQPTNIEDLQGSKGLSFCKKYLQDAKKVIIRFVPHKEGVNTLWKKMINSVDTKKPQRKRKSCHVEKKMTVKRVCVRTPERVLRKPEKVLTRNHRNSISSSSWQVQRRLSPKKNTSVKTAVPVKVPHKVPNILRSGHRRWILNKNIGISEKESSCSGNYNCRASGYPENLIVETKGESHMHTSGAFEIKESVLVTRKSSYGRNSLHEKERRQEVRGLLELLSGEVPQLKDKNKTIAVDILKSAILHIKKLHHNYASLICNRAKLQELNKELKEKYTCLLQDESLTNILKSVKQL